MTDDEARALIRDHRRRVRIDELSIQALFSLAEVAHAAADGDMDRMIGKLQATTAATNEIGRLLKETPCQQQ